jgi:large subunit ribosomal protein L10
MQTLDSKKEIVSDLTSRVNESTGVYLADFKGMDVATVTGLRESFREKGIQMQVVKNTLLKRVFEECQIAGLDDSLVGPTSLILADGEDPIQPAKLIADFHKRNEGQLSVKAVQMDGQVYSGDRLGELAKMPGKVELQTQVISLALGAGGNLLGLVKGPGSQIAGQISALVEKLEKEEQ